MNIGRKNFFPNRFKKYRAFPSQGLPPEYLPRVETIASVDVKTCPVATASCVSWEDKSERLDIVSAKFRIVAASEICVDRVSEIGVRGAWHLRSPHGTSFQRSRNCQTIC
jgi:hypothetical protein